MTPLFIPMLAAFSSGLAFAVMQLQLKHLTTPTTSPFFLPHFLGYLFPVWAALFILTDATGALTYTLTPQALLFPLGWAAMTSSTTVILMFLFQKFSLTEVVGYRKALVTLGALGLDVFLFSLHMPWSKLAAVGFLLAGAIGLSQSAHRLPTRREVLILLVWCFMFTVQLAFYKEGIQHQPHIMSNTILCQGFNTLIYACFSALPFAKTSALSATSVPSGNVSVPLLPLLTVLACALFGTMVEGFGYAKLPLSVALLLTLLPAALFAAHDILGGHIARTFKAYMALGSLAVGLGLLIFGH
jgi:hypothetical protein